MIDALIAGRVHGQPTSRTGKSGKPFAVAKVRAAVRPAPTPERPSHDAWRAAAPHDRNNQGDFEPLDF